MSLVKTSQEVHPQLHKVLPVQQLGLRVCVLVLPLPLLASAPHLLVLVPLSSALRQPHTLKYWLGSSLTLGA